MGPNAPGNGSELALHRKDGDDCSSWRFDASSVPVVALTGKAVDLIAACSAASPMEEPKSRPSQVLSGDHSCAHVAEPRTLDQEYEP